MAERKKNDRTGLRQAIATSAAFAGGLAYGIQRKGGISNLTKASHREAVISKPNQAKKVLDSVMEEYKGVGGFRKYQKGEALGALDVIESTLKQRGRPTNVVEAIAREWEAAAAAIHPDPTQLPDFRVSSRDPFEGIRLALKQSKSPYTLDVFRRFAGNVDLLLAAGLPGQMRDLSRITDIPQAMQWTKGALEPGLAGIVSDIEEMYGMGKFRVMRRGPAGTGEIGLFAGGKQPLITLPETFTGGGQYAGLVRTGRALENIRAPGLFTTVGAGGQMGEMLTFSELKAQRIREAMRGALQTPGANLNKAISDVEEQLGKYLDFMEPSFAGTDVSFETMVKGQRLTAFDVETGGEIAGARRRAFLARYGETLTPMGSRARFSMIPSAELYGGFFPQIDYARKPWQWIRQYKPSFDATREILESPFGGRTWDFLDSPAAIKHFNGPSGPRFKTLYLSDEQISSLRELGFPVGDGELLVNRAMQRQAEVTRLRRVSLREVSQEAVGALAEARTGGEAFPGVKGIVGRDVTGNLIRLGARERILGAQRTMVGRGDEAGQALNLLIEETLPMGTYEKRFGGLKGMARAVSFRGDLGKKLALMTGLPAAEIATFGAIGRLGDITKNPADELMQQFSGMLLRARNMPANPLEDLSRIRGAKDPSAALMQYGRGLGLTEQDLSFVTGASARVGVTRLSYGGPKEFTGAGKMGTIEPRILTLLQGQGTTFGEQIGRDLVGRVLSGDPERLMIHNELAKTLASMAPGAPAGRGKGYMTTGLEALPSIYIPDYKQFDELAKLRPMKIDGQMVTTSPISKIFRGLETDIKAYRGGGLTAEEFMDKIQGKGGYVTQLMHQYAPGGRGQGSFLRGRVGGSRFLTAVSGRGEFLDKVSRLGLDETRVIGVPYEMGQKMINEVGFMGEDVTSMLQRWERGQAIGGAVARHPFIGPYSMQQVMMLPVNEAEPVMYVPEATRRLSMMVNGKIMEETVTDGILQGLALDKDADIPMAVALNAHMEETVREQLGKGVGDLAYESHNIRMQLLKAKARDAGDVLTRAEQIAAAGSKLAIVDEEVGRLSVQLTKARAAVMQSNIGQAEQLRALGLLEWLEQQPISGKHLTPSAVMSGAFEQQMAAIRKGVQGNPELLTRSIENMLITEGMDPDKKALYSGLLGKGVQLTKGTMASGIDFIEGFQLETTAKQITSAMQGFMSSSDGMAQADILRYMQPGRMTNFTREQIPGALQMHRDMNVGAKKGLHETQKRILSTMNEISAAVKSRVRPLVAPMGIGLAAAAGASVLFAEPPGIMEEPEGGLSRIQAANATPQTVIPRSSGDDLPPPDMAQQILGEPTVTPQMTPTAQMLDSEMGKRGRALRASIMANNVTPRQRQQLAERLTSRFPGQMDVNVRDSRRSLNHSTVSDMLD